jgi:hypothetical protein
MARLCLAFFSFSGDMHTHRSGSFVATYFFGNGVSFFHCFGIEAFFNEE